MPDAEIIPLGTRGRPGRGSGSNRPSSAARTLAPPKPRKRTAGSAPAADEPASPDLEVVDEEQPVTAPAATAPESAAEGAATATGEAADDAADDVTEEPTEVRDREPAGGIPVGDWVQAISSAGREVFGDRWEERTAELLALLRRRLTGDFEVDEYGYDAEVAERFVLAAARPLKDKWFRIEVRGAENIPVDGGALVVSNHSGTIPMDSLMTMVSVHDETSRTLRPLGADLVFRLPVVGGLARKSGATLACNEDAQRMLSGGELVGVWPEGFKGIGKPYSERYKLQRFGRGGFVAAAIRTGVPIIPCSVVGAEEIYPLVGNIPALARLVGLPYLPITPFFPLLGPLGLIPLPSKWLIEFGEPIRTDAYDEGAADDPMLVFNVTDQVRETIQQTLYSLLMQRRSVFY
jgi:1-acyl-sn-glycerol-3-phosphate acyltransferase